MSRSRQGRRGRARWSRVGVVQRVAAALVVVALVPLAFTSWRLITINQRSMQDQVLQTQTLAARTAADAISTFVATRRALARSVAAHPEVRALGGGTGAVVQQGLQSWGDLQVEAVGLFDDEGAMILGARLVEGPLPLTEMALNPFEDDLAFERVGDRRVLLVRASVREDVALILACAVRPLTAALRPHELGGESESTLALIGREGEIELGALQRVHLPPSLVRAATSGRIDGSGLFGDVGGEEVLAAYAVVESAPWSVLALQPRRVAEAVAGRMRRSAALALMASVALLAALLALSYASLVRPLRRLADAQLALAGSSGVGRTGDLVTDLEASFEALEQRVRDSEQLSEVFLGRYQVVEMIGRGGMGTVFRGWDPKLEREVALKTVRFDRAEVKAETSGHVESLMREAVTAARLNHPNVVTIHDVAEAGDAAYVAMELVDGISLEQMLLRGPLEPDQLSILGRSVCSALQAAHARDVLHRDVKTANVLMGYDGSIKVTDFGLAELASAAAPPGDTVFGTPGYIAPEVLAGEVPTPAADLFALGVVLYESATGYPPFHAWEVEKTLKKTMEGKFIEISELRPGVDPRVTELTHRLLSILPGQRPDAEEILAVLETVEQETHATWAAPERRLDAGEGDSEYATRPKHEGRYVPTRELERRDPGATIRQNPL